ncbi:hypothetical protein IGI04_007010 [Brassica rapa subsp. trilocularis]|uniref:DUF287 domain-containing protein n=1 Tax=Brassica rapa subsp. trilocularis TaxID=1813537 RepID=A0ABQ7NKM2_BRACM|nr:hypothetical protein IGI04_007010 [Brassica rapa subsp. trilocularis]
MRGGMEQKLKLKVMKRVLILMIKLWSQMINKKELNQEAMGSEEDDETFVRRNRLLQEAITKQVMEAMVKLLEEKYDQRPHDGQGQASGSRHEQRRNRQGQREHAGSEETDNFYERSSHSSGSRRSTEVDEVLTIPKGPMTRARARKLKEAIGGLIRKSLEQEECQKMGLACGSARREEKEERGNEWGWFSQMKATLKRCGVWRNHEKEESLKGKAAEKDQTARETSGSCFSLEESTLLEKIEDVYENKISLRRVYEVKKVISGVKPGREEFNNHVRKLQHLWVELQGLRSHVDGDTTQDQETVLKLLASMESSYGWLVEMVLRGEQLPEMEEICGLIRKAYEIMRDDERLTMSRSESSWKPTGSRSESFQKLTMSRSEGSWRLTGSRSEGFRKKRRCRMLSKASINIGKGRKRVVGECSYSAYMGESVEDSGVLREQEKGSGADDRITRKEWRVEAERTTPLDHERGNGTESHEQVQNQEDSGQHNQEVTQEVESGAQSSGDGQRESTGSDESGTQSSGDWEVDHDGSNESGAQSITTWEVI